MKGTELSDGKTLQGRGRLADKVVEKLQTQYGIAIMANKNSLTKMRGKCAGSVRSPPVHLTTTANCPHKKAEASGELYNFKHKSSLPSAVTEAIKPKPDSLQYLSKQRTHVDKEEDAQLADYTNDRRQSFFSRALELNTTDESEQVNDSVDDVFI